MAEPQKFLFPIQVDVSSNSTYSSYHLYIYIYIYINVICNIYIYTYYIMHLDGMIKNPPKTAHDGNFSYYVPNRAKGGAIDAEAHGTK